MPVWVCILHTAVQKIQLCSLLRLCLKIQHEKKSIPHQHFRFPYLIKQTVPEQAAVQIDHQSSGPSVPQIIVIISPCRFNLAVAIRGVYADAVQEKMRLIFPAVVRPDRLQSGQIVHPRPAVQRFPEEMYFLPLRTAAAVCLAEQHRQISNAQLLHHALYPHFQFPAVAAVLIYQLMRQRNGNLRARSPHHVRKLIE